MKKTFDLQKISEISAHEEMKKDLKNILEKMENAHSHEERMQSYVSIVHIGKYALSVHDEIKKEKK